MHKLWHIYWNAFAAKGQQQNGNICWLYYIIIFASFFFLGKFGAMLLASRKIATQIEVVSFRFRVCQFVFGIKHEQHMIKF